MKYDTAALTVPTSPSRADAEVRIERLTKLSAHDLNDLCDATVQAIEADGGFGWLTPPETHVLEAFWNGVLLVPGREVFVGRLDGVIVGSAQLQHPPRNNEAQAHAALLTTSFVAPWARGHGVAHGLTARIEAEARDCGYAFLKLDVRETQRAAIAMYEHRGFVCWGTDPVYAMIDGETVRGFHYTKDLRQDLDG